VLIDANAFANPTGNTRLSDARRRAVCVLVPFISYLGLGDDYLGALDRKHFLNEVEVRVIDKLKENWKIK
jgi:hypothetical protein